MRPRIKSHVYNAIKEDGIWFNASLEKMICREEATRQHIAYLNDIIEIKDSAIKRILTLSLVGWVICAALCLAVLSL